MSNKTRTDETELRVQRAWSIFAFINSSKFGTDYVIYEDFEESKDYVNHSLMSELHRKPVLHWDAECSFIK